MIAYQTKLTPEEYFAGEQQSEIRHEYINGDVYAMSGASEAHNLMLVMCLRYCTHICVENLVELSLAI